METAQPSAIGSLLVRARKSADLTQEALAERAGVSVNTISNLEAGRGHLPRRATLDLLLAALAGAIDPPEWPSFREAFEDLARATHARRLATEPERPSVRQVVPASHAPPSGTLTFLVCAPTARSGRHLEQQPASLAPTYGLAAQLLQIVEPRGGWVVDRLDGPDAAVAVFTRVDEAVSAACAMQQALLGPRTGTADGAAAAGVGVCVALHTGWAEPGSGEYAGPTRHRAARLARLGHGGQILLSTHTRELVQSTPPEGVSLQKLGQHNLLAVERPEPIFQIRHPGLPGDFPPLRATQAPATNLPVQLTSFVGREQEQSLAGTLLARAPMVTLTGSGGCGKTRLALQVAADLRDGYADGTWLVELASLTDQALVPQAVAATLGLREEPGRPLLATILGALGSRQMLLVLDNCEQLVAACAEMAVALLQGCPHLQLLATSRERLGIRGETTYRVPSLALPTAGQQPTVAELGQYAAVQLFVERARACQPAFTLGADNAGVVAQICARLDGIPLAIELAAARIGSLVVETIAARLDQSIGLLTGGPRDVLPRHQTLRATLDWSWELLSGREQMVLRRLAIFSGGWSLGAAEAVCAGEGIEGWAMAEVLDGLVGKSLVGLDETAGTRYGLLETVRQFGLERLDAAGELAATRERHLSWCLELAQEAEPALIGPEQQAWATRLEAEHDNLRAALTRSVQEGHLPASGLRLASMLWRFWLMGGHLGEGQRWLERALATTSVAPIATRASALLGAGNLSHRHGDYQQAATRYRQGLALQRELGDRHGIAGALNGLGLVAWSLGDYAEARLAFEESLALGRELGLGRGVANSLVNLGNVANSQGDFQRARALYEEGLAQFRAVGDTFNMATGMNNLADLAAYQGDFELAARLQRESLALRREMGDTTGIAQSLSNLGKAVYLQGDAVQGMALLEESVSLNREIGDSQGLASALSNLGNLVYHQGEYERAEGVYAESLTLARRAGSKENIVIALTGLGRAAHRRGIPTHAFSLHRQGLVLAREIGNSGLVAHALEGLAGAVVIQGEARQAARLLGAAEQLRESLGAALWAGERIEHDHAARAVCETLGERRFAAMWAEGRALPLEEAVALALTEAQERIDVGS